jgi:hypothetical protein
MLTTWICCLAILLATLPNCGYVWCVRGDRDIALETIDFEGQCDHQGRASTEMAQPRHAAAIRDLCVDVAAFIGELQAVSVEIKSPDLSPPATVYLPHLVALLPATSDYSDAPQPHPPEAARADAKTLLGFTTTVLLI